MDGLDGFEKALAAEKAERENKQAGRDGQERRGRKHRHHHRHEHRDSKDREDRRHRGDDDDEGHGSKRSRHARGDGDGDGEHHRPRHRHHHRRDDVDKQSGGGRPRRGAEDADAHGGQGEGHEAAPVRDAWMTKPSALLVEPVGRRRAGADEAGTPPREEPKRVIHARELNQHHLQKLNDGVAVVPPASEVPSGHAARSVDYTFGDAGSSWRMTRLRGVYTTAESSGRPVEEVAVERYGSLREFDDAREEQEEMERRRVYGPGYRGKEAPAGDLFLEREREREQQQRQGRRQDSDTSAVAPDADAEPDATQGRVTAQQPAPTDQTALNRMRAQMMKAKLRRAPNAAQLEQEYSRAAAALASPLNQSSSPASAPQAVVLGTMHNRQLAGPRGEVKPVETKRGRERGLVQENADMTIEDMVREERRTRNAPDGEALRLAERIAKDTAFDDNLEYMDEQAAKLAQRVHKSDLGLKNMAVSQFQRLSRVLDACPLCHHDENGRPPVAPVVSLATRVFLTLPPEPEVSPGGALVVPLSHRVNLLECDDDEWEEVRNFMKALTRMYHEQGRDVLFYENAAAPQRHRHAAMVAVPIPYSEGAMAPAHFREAFLSADEEWAVHRKVIDTGAAARDGALGRMAFRRTLAREMPYFHVWFTLDGGLGHVVEDGDRWPRGDLFAREVVGGIVDADPGLVKKEARWVRGRREEQRVEAWKKEGGWRKFDWTRVLAGES